MMESVRNIEVRDKLLAVRVDLNSPMRDGKVVMNRRIEEHAKTIKKLMDIGARVVVLAHQGRKGKEDFRSLEEHAKLLKECNCDIEFVGDVVGERARRAVESLESGRALLLDNVRFLDDETEKRGIEGHAKSAIVRFLSEYIDLFVLDAFSVAHRDNASVVGFATLKPCVYGYVFERELNIARMFRDEVDLGEVFIPMEDGIPFYSNSIIPYYVDLPIDKRAELEGEVQRKFTGGVMMHLFFYETPDPNSLKKLVKRIATETKVVYFSITPAISVCLKCGWHAVGVYEKCPKCGKYTLKETCPLCGEKTKLAHPPKFSTEDPYGE